jgi:hypothetical protein
MPVLDALVLAAVFLAALLGLAAVLRPLLVAVLKDMPLVGGWLSSNVDAKLGDFVRAITPGANAAMPALTALLRQLYVAAWSFLSDVADGFEVLGKVVDDLKSLDVPKAVGDAETLAQTWIAAARSDVLGVVRDVETRLDGVVDRLRSELATVYGQALDYARGLVGLEVERAQQVEQALLGDAKALALEAERAALAEVGRVEQEAQSLVAFARQEAQVAASAVERDLQALANAERVALKDSLSVLGGDIQSVEQRANAALSDLDKSVQKSIEGILASTPWAALAAQVNTGEAMLQADVKLLVALGAKAIRDELGNVEALRAKYVDQVKAAAEQLGAG